MDVQQAVIAVDISWNKPFKDYYTKCYGEWFEASKQEFTAGRNPKSAPLKDIIACIVKAWGNLSREVIMNSVKTCGFFLLFLLFFLYIFVQRR